MNKAVCILQLSRKISYACLNNSKYFRYNFTKLVDTRPISVYNQRFYSQQQTTNDSNDEKVLQTIELYVRNKDFGKAFDLYHAHRQDNELFTLNDVISLTLIRAMIKTDRHAYARQIVNDMNENANLGYPKEANSILYEIFTMLSSTKKTDDLDWFMDNLVFARKYVDDMVLGHLMGIQLAGRNDLQNGLKLFTRIVGQFKKVPWLPALLKKCIEADDIGNLKAMIDLANQNIGQKNTKFNLAFVYVEVGNIKEAKRVFGTLFDLTSKDYDRVEKQMTSSKIRRDNAFLENLLAATEDFVPVELRLRIFETLLLLNSGKNVERAQQLCDIMIIEGLKPKTDLKAINAAFARNNIKIPADWKLEKINISKDDHENKLRSLLEDNRLNEANQLFIDSSKNRKRYGKQTIANLLRQNAEAGNVHTMDILRTVIHDKIKWDVAFYSNECMTYMTAKRHMEYLPLVQWEISQKHLANLPTTIIDLIIDCPEIYGRLLELANQCDSVDNIRLPCLLWAYNFIENVNPRDNDRLWYAHLKDSVSTSVGVLTDILYQRKRIDKLQEFLNSHQFEKRRIKPQKLEKCYCRLFDGLLQKGDHANLIVELKKASKLISIKNIDSGTLERLKNESTEIAAVVEDLSGNWHV